MINDSITRQFKLAFWPPNNRGTKVHLTLCVRQQLFVFLQTYQDEDKSQVIVALITNYLLEKWQLEHFGFEKLWDFFWLIAFIKHSLVSYSLTNVPTLSIHIFIFVRKQFIFHFDPTQIVTWCQICLFCIWRPCLMLYFCSLTQKSVTNP